MRQVCRKFARSLSVLTFFALASGAAAAQSQSRDLRLISARAGGVNYVAGDARVAARGSNDWRALDIKRNLEQGDSLKTGVAGRVEVLLNPGSYLRVGEHSELELTDTSLENLRVKLLKGSALVEATGYDDLDPAITVVTPQTEVSILRSGVYRFNVLPGGVTEVVVVKGRAAVGDLATLVKGGKVARVGAAGVEIVKYDKKTRDDLDLWSKERGSDLAEANRGLSRRNVRTLLADARWDSLFSARGLGYGRAGVWVWNAGRGCFTFLPAFGGWASPYGGYYDSSFYGPYGQYCNSCGGYGGARPVISNNGRTPVRPGN